MNLVLDFGAVLFTWQPAQLLAEHYPRWVSHHGQAQALAQAIFHHPDWLDFDRGVLAQDEVVARTAQRLHWSAADVQDLVSGVGRNLQPMTGTLALLKRLVERRTRQGDVRLYFLSNMPAPLARTLEATHDFLAWFDGGLFSGDAGQIKPEPGIYQLMQARYQLEPARTLFVDDMLVNVEAARMQGWHAIAFSSSAQLDQDLQAWGL